MLDEEREKTDQGKLVQIKREIREKSGKANEVEDYMFRGRRLNKKVRMLLEC